MTRSFQLGLAAALLGASVLASAAELAVLRNGFEIRHDRREQLGAITRLYVGSDTETGYVEVPTEQIASFEPAPVEPSPRVPSALKPEDLHSYVAAASDRHKIDPDLIASVIRAESNFNPRAVSSKGAQGLMQLMPGTASLLGVTDAFQADANIDAGTRYLRELLLRYNDDLPKALAAYNAGPKRVDQYRGVPPYRETHAYVAGIIRDFNQKKLSARPKGAAQKAENARRTTHHSSSSSLKRAKNAHSSS